MTTHFISLIIVMKAVTWRDMLKKWKALWTVLPSRRWRPRGVRPRDPRSGTVAAGPDTPHWWRPQGADHRCVPTSRPSCPSPPHWGPSSAQWGWAWPNNTSVRVTHTSPIRHDNGYIGLASECKPLPEWRVVWAGWVQDPPEWSRRPWQRHRGSASRGVWCALWWRAVRAAPHRPHNTWLKASDTRQQPYTGSSHRRHHSHPSKGTYRHLSNSAKVYK